MKKYFKYYALALLAITSLSSCLDEDPVFEPDGGPAGIVELSLAARTSSTPYAIRSTTIEVEDSFDVPVIVNYTGAKGAPKDVEVTIAIDDAIVAAGSSNLALPTAFYDLPASNVVTIPKGQKTAIYLIKVKPKLFDLTKSYALGVKIVSSTGGTISGNYSAGVYTLPVKSPWQGTYNVHYHWYVGGGAGSEEEEYDETGIKLSTAGPGIVEAQLVGQWFSGYTQYTHKLDGSLDVLVYSGSNRAVGIVSSSYDLNARTFTVRYWFIAPTSYELEETYVRTGD
ncbi:hypothetical protein FACS189432_01120 [Bacteroidia bacterium]|nr:hypothetical protein FACS189426_03380 [Bacteroidia bacterium]GHT26528.1 hypothetical protein FACS189432_01120 [Bacteroidia bacterium]GHV71092.1 hypothetical protein FACS189420_4860 [Bacteroidia bacterium]